MDYTDEEKYNLFQIALILFYDGAYHLCSELLDSIDA